MLLLFSFLLTTISSFHFHHPKPKSNGNIYAGRQYTVDGLSSGAFFSVQYGVAWSSEVFGINVVAGGPYYCAKDSETTALTACMSEPSGISVNQLVSDTKSFATKGDIDPVSNIANQKVFVYAGTKDGVVNPKVGSACAQYFEDFDANVTFKNDVASQHGLPTDKWGTKCDPIEAEEPYIENCGVDLAGIMLQYLYDNKLKSRSNSVSYNVHDISQDNFTPTGKTTSSISLEKKAYYYLPSNCSIAPLSENCNLHVVFHGCEQYLECNCFDCDTKNDQFNDTYVKHGGYIEWAQPNNIVVLFPQADKSELDPSNPNGCWDWWGYNTKNYAFQSGEQMSTVHNMVQYILTGSKQWLTR